MAEISNKRSYLAVISFLAALVIYLLSFPLLSHIGGGTFHDDRRGLSGRLNGQNLFYPTLFFIKILFSFVCLKV